MIYMLLYVSLITRRQNIFAPTCVLKVIGQPWCQNKHNYGYTDLGMTAVTICYLALALTVVW